MSETEKDAAAREFLQPTWQFAGEDPHKGTLTPPELEAVRCISHGLTNEMAAEVLGKSVHTVARQLGSARKKLNAKTRAHLVALAYRQGLIS